jgi:hypothetical protein
MLFPDRFGIVQVQRVVCLSCWLDRRAREGGVEQLLLFLPEVFHAALVSGNEGRWA